MNIGITIPKGGSQYKLNNAYVDYIINAGFNPILIPYGSDTDTMVGICDGILIPGGIDIEPTFYGENNLASHAVDPERDAFERAVLHSAIIASKPVFGICRGYQLIVREFMRLHEDDLPHSISFYQHINDHSLASARSIPRNVPSHSVAYNPMVLYGAGEDVTEQMFVNSMHHQALVVSNNDLIININEHNRLKAIAVTTYGKPSKAKELVVEAVDAIIDDCWLRGVQWHPEELNDVALITHYFNAASENIITHNNAEINAAEV